MIGCYYLYDKIQVYEASLSGYNQNGRNLSVRFARDACGGPSVVQTAEPMLASSVWSPLLNSLVHVLHVQSHLNRGRSTKVCQKH